MGEPARIGDDAVEMVAVNHPERAAIGGFVNGFPPQFHAGKAHAAIIPEELVVIAWHIDDTRPFLNLLENKVEHRAVCRAPVPVLLEPPAIDDVADEIERLAIIVDKKIGQEFSLA